MVKVILPGSQSFGAQVAQAVKVSARGLVGGDLADFVKRSSHYIADAARGVDLRPGEDLVHMIAVGSGESHGCFPAGTPVHTETGLQAIEAIREGEKVLTHNNRYRRVTSLFKRKFSGKLISIKACGLPLPVSMTDNHPVYVVKAEDFAIQVRARCFLEKDGKTKEQAVTEAVDKVRKVRADEVETGDFVVVPTSPEYDGPAYPQDMAYAYGLYVAEGCTDKQNRVIYILNRENDKDVFARLKEAFGGYGYCFNIYDCQSSERGLRAECTWEDFAVNCVALCGHGAKNKFLHPSVFVQSKEWKLDFLAGYFDGDGCLNVNRKMTRYENVLRASTVSLNLALDVQRLLASLLIPSSVTLGYNHKKNGCFGTGEQDLPIYEICVGSAYSEEIVSHCSRLKIVNRFKRNRNANQQLSGKYILMPVRRIDVEEVEDIDVFNIEVYEDHSYITTFEIGNGCWAM
jgi:hypothetical protein